MHPTFQREPGLQGLDKGFGVVVSAIFEDKVEASLGETVFEVISGGWVAMGR